MANERENISRNRGEPSQQEGEDLSASGGALHELVRRARAGDLRAAAQLRRAQAQRRAARESGDDGSRAEATALAGTPAAAVAPEHASQNLGAGRPDSQAGSPAIDSRTPAEELATYGLTVDEFKDYCRHHTQRGWDGSQAAGLVDMFLISRKVEKIPDGVRRRLKHALFNQGDQTLVMEEIGGAAVIGTRQDNAERRADAAAQMERETLGNMTGGFAGALLGGIQQEIDPDDRAKIHAASGVGALVDNMGAAHEMSRGNAPRFETPREFATYQHGAPTHQATIAAERLRGAIAEKGAPRVEQRLLSRGMSPDDIKLARGAIKKNSQASATDPTLMHKNADGSVREPLSHDEKNALLKANDLLLGDVRPGATVRKVYPNRDVGHILHGEGVFRGKVVPFDQMGGDIALAHHTDGLSAHDTVAKLGLDYEHNPHEPDFSGPAKGQFTDVDATGQVTVSEEVRKNRLHYVDQSMTADQVHQAKVPLADDTFAHAQEHSTQPDRYAKKSRTGPQDNPYTGNGMPASNALVDDHGRPFLPTISQEMNAGRHPYQPGATLWARADAGTDQLVARYVQTGVDAAGKPRCRWVLDAGLTPARRAYYEGLIRKAQEMVNAARAGGTP